jgi:hypothetical protein
MASSIWGRLVHEIVYAALHLAVQKEPLAPHVGHFQRIPCFSCEDEDFALNVYPAQVGPWIGLGQTGCTRVLDNLLEGDVAIELGELRGCKLPQSR